MSVVWADDSWMHQFDWSSSLFRMSRWNLSLSVSSGLQPEELSLYRVMMRQRTSIPRLTVHAVCPCSAPQRSTSPTKNSARNHWSTCCWLGAIRCHLVLEGDSFWRHYDRRRLSSVAEAPAFCDGSCGFRPPSEYWYQQRWAWESWIPVEHLDPQYLHLRTRPTLWSSSNFVSKSCSAYSRL